MTTGKETRNKKKLASAITGAITAYIRMEEEARTKESEKSPGKTINLWGVSARQDTMQLQRLCQLRVIRR